MLPSHKLLLSMERILRNSDTICVKGQWWLNRFQHRQHMTALLKRNHLQRCECTSTWKNTSPNKVYDTLLTVGPISMMMSVSRLLLMLWSRKNHRFFVRDIKLFSQIWRISNSQQWHFVQGVSQLRELESLVAFWILTIQAYVLSTYPPLPFNVVPQSEKVWAPFSYREN